MHQGGQKHGEKNNEIIWDNHQQTQADNTHRPYHWFFDEGHKQGATKGNKTEVGIEKKRI